MTDQPTSEQDEDLPNGDIYNKFDSLFSDVDSTVGILLHPFPDPDSLGAGYALKWLLEKQYGLETDILYTGEISHPQNRTAKNVLDLRLKQRETIEQDEYDAFATVDCVPSTSGFDVEIDAVFDHHHKDCDGELVDIRTTGSTCAIIWDYLSEFGFKADSEEAKLVATALVFGILNDTHQLVSENVSQLDIDAHSALIGEISRQDFHDIMQFPLPPYLFDLRVKAAENRHDEGSVLVSGLGVVSPKRRDALPIIADEFLRLEGIETVIVFALIDGYIQASVRSRNSSVNVSSLCEEVFKQEFSGGKAGSGGAKVPVGPLYSADQDEETLEDVWEVAERVFRKRIETYVQGG